MMKHWKRWSLIIILPFFLVVILIIMMISMFGSVNNKSETMDLDCANNLNVQGNNVSQDQEKNAKQLWDFLISKGWSPASVAGVLGNLQQESQIKPSSTNPTSGAHGICQWLGDRLTNEQSFAKQHGKDPDSIQAQIMFLYEEANGSEKVNLGDYAKSQTDPATAAVQWELRFERAGSGEARNDVRAQNAVNWYNKFKDSKTATTNDNSTTITDTNATCNAGAGKALNVKGPSDPWWNDLSKWANKWVDQVPQNYSYGGNPNTLDNTATAKAVHGATDCSGFTLWAFGKIGVTLPRTAEQQFHQSCDEVSEKDAKAGDLVFFDSADEGELCHVGIYLGNGEMIDEQLRGIVKEKVWPKNDPNYSNITRIRYGRIKGNLYHH